MLLPLSTSTKGLPAGSSWKRVSSYRIAPEMYWLMPGVVKRRLRHVWRFASVFSRPMDSRRLPTVPVDSSQAKRPLPGSTMEFAVWTSSSAYFSRLICGAAARGALRCCVENVFVGTSADAGALRARARMADFIVDSVDVILAV